MFLTKVVKRAIVEALDEREKLSTDIHAARLEIAGLKEQLKELKTTKRMEERELEQLVKCKIEKQDLEHEKRRVSLQEEFNRKEMAQQTKYHEEKIAQLGKEQDRLEKLYTQILARLPNVNVDIRKGEGFRKED